MTVDDFYLDLCCKAEAAFSFTVVSTLVPVPVPIKIISYKQKIKTLLNILIVNIINILIVRQATLVTNSRSAICQSQNLFFAAFVQKKEKKNICFRKFYASFMVRYIALAVFRIRIRIIRIRM